MPDKYRLIRDAEIAFARRAALGMIVRRPVKPLLQLVPGMFIIDFVRRSVEIRKYTRRYMFPREPALAAARVAISSGAAPGRAEIEAGLREVAAGSGLSAEAAVARWAELVTLLCGHYTRLLEAQGGDYHELVRKAYGRRREYEDFLARLTVAEEEAGRAAGEAPGAGRDAETLSLRETRRKDIEAIFYGLP
ncbi:MAG: NF038143 family protein [Thermodesulfobacteriota bacterium]